MTLKGMFIFVMFIAAGALGSSGASAAVPVGTLPGLSSVLYSGWRDQMRIVAYTAHPILPKSQTIRLQQVWAIEGQNQRAAGMIAIMQRLHGGATLTNLADDLAGINVGIDEMLVRMSSGYTGRTNSRASAADIAYLRLLVQRRILATLPASLPSDDAVRNSLPALQSLDAYVMRQVNTRFVKPHKHP